MTEQFKIKLQLLALFTAVCLAWILTGALVYYSIDDWSERGQFGDMFGAVNALFSGLAFAGLIVAIQLQRNELELTRKELGRSAKAQEEASRALTAQIEVQIMASRLNALNTLLASANSRLDAMYADNRASAAGGSMSGWETADVARYRSDCETEIETILAQLKRNAESKSGNTIA